MVAAPARVDLLVLVVDATVENFDEEQAIARRWSDAGLKVILFINKFDLISEADSLRLAQPWDAALALIGSAKDTHFLLERFVPAVMRLLPDKHLALGRQ